MENREQRFKTYREKIINEDLKEDKNNTTLEAKNIEDNSKILQDKQVKKNTLTMSIDQIIEAHDEYTIIIEQKELEEKIRKEKRDKMTAKLKVIFKYALIGLILLLVVFILVLIILKIIG